jgi:Heterokaryon incompatibility protein Het-C
MAGFQPSSSFVVLTGLVILLIFYAQPVQAFGAGNIASLAKIEGQNWRHGFVSPPSRFTSSQ